MGANANGPVWENGAADDESERASERTPHDPLPPGFLDLGDGTLFGGGTAADCRAAAAWLHRHYPGRSKDPATGHTGPIFAMLIHHSRLLGNFARLPNETLRDERLSIAARGHLAYLLSMPDGWNTTADAEAKRARSLRGKRGEGRDAMRRIYAELKAVGYIHYVKTQDNGTWSTEIYVFDRPRTDVRLTDIPETRMSVPPAETPEPAPEPVDNCPDCPDEFSQVAPMYGSPGVGTPDVGTPVHRQAVHSYEDRTTEDEERMCAVDGEAGDLGGPGVAPRHNEDHDQGQDQEQPNANSEDHRVHVGPDETSLDASQPVTGTTTGTPQTARDPAESAPPQNLHPAESAALSEPAETAASDATISPESFEDHRRAELDRFEAWMREHPEAAERSAVTS